MNPLDKVNEYLMALEARLRWTALSRGAAAIALAALGATLVLVLVMNAYAFSEPVLRLARVLLFLCLGVAITFGLAAPLLRVNRRWTAKLAERRVPEFKERLLTFAERAEGDRDPWFELLAADTLDVARRAEPETVIGGRCVFGSLSAATISAVLLMWLILAGPGFLGHGASLLWAGAPRRGASVAFYQVLVSPGDRTVRKRSDQVVKAQLAGFTASKATLFARFAGTSKWEQAPMVPEGPGFEFLFAGLPDTVEYYVEAGGVRSKTHKLTAIDLPGVKKLRVTYEYPRWSGLKNVVEDPGGDLRAIEGSVATVEIETDQRLAEGVLLLDDGARVALSRGEGNWLSARVPIQKDGMYHLAAVERGEDIRLSEDYFIEAQKEEPPKVRIARPWRDARVNPIEEVSVMVEAEDDFGLQDVVLHYSVNGGPEKIVPMLASRGAKTVEGQTLIALEDFKMVPGDVVSLYATARDARAEARSDILFVEAQPFEREYSQSQLAGGGGGGGAGQEQENVSQRQKEIIAATFNQLRDRSGDRRAAAENAKFLSEMQSKLRDQAASLAKRMRSRELTGASQEFRSFANDMEQAANAMSQASEKLKGQNWKDAISPEQKALQHLLRAEATRRQIQVAFGMRGGGGGGGGAGRDLESLFDLELDLEKNQYETGQQSASADERAREVDEALQRLEQLARRQQELAEQQQNRQSPQLRWQQEMLRREAEQLRRKMEELARNTQQSSRGQQQGQQTGQQGQQGGQQSAAGGQGGQSGGMDSRLRQAVERLTRATDDMRRAASAQNQPQSAGSDARRAAERLQEARNALGSLRQQESGQELDSIARRAEQLSAQQNAFVEKLRKAFPAGQQGQVQTQPGQSQAQADALAREKEQMMAELSRLERDMQGAVRNLAGSQRSASSRLREALGEMQQNELKTRMRYHAEWIRRGLGGYIAPREAPITEGLARLAEQTRQAQAALGQGAPNDEKQQGVERALNQVERLRAQLARAAEGARRQGQPGQQGQEGQQQGQGQGRGQGQQQGKQAGGNPPGDRGEPGRMGESRGQGSGQWGGQRGGYGDWDRMYRSGDAIPEQGPMTNAGIENALRQGMRELSQMRQELRQTSPDLEREAQEALREIQKYDPAKIASDPKLAERIQSTVLPMIEQLELQLRRKLEGESGGQVRTSATERVPQGYADAVAEYFRRLSRGK